MNFVRHAVLACCAGGLISAVSSWSGVAQPFPTRPVTMIVPAAAGGPLDVIARVLSEPIRSSLAWISTARNSANVALNSI